MKYKFGTMKLTGNESKDIALMLDDELEGDSFVAISKKVAGASEYERMVAEQKIQAKDAEIKDAEEEKNRIELAAYEAEEAAKEATKEAADRAAEEIAKANEKNSHVRLSNFEGKDFGFQSFCSKKLGKFLSQVGFLGTDVPLLEDDGYKTGYEVNKKWESLNYVVVERGDIINSIYCTPKLVEELKKMYATGKMVQYKKVNGQKVKLSMILTTGQDEYIRRYKRS